MFDLGDEVITYTPDGYKEGRIVTAINSYVNGAYVKEYGIKFEDSPIFIKYFTEDQIIMKTIITTCDCGAEATHYPKVPPGHAYWCSVNKRRTYV